MKNLCYKHFHKGENLKLTIKNNIYTEAEVDFKPDSGFVNIEHSIKSTK